MHLSDTSYTRLGKTAVNSIRVFHILMSIVLDHEWCIEWYIFTHLYVICNVIKFGDVLQYVSKGVFSVMLTSHKLL